MSSARLQDTRSIYKNQLYALMMNNLKMKLGKKNPFTIASKRIKYLE